MYLISSRFVVVGLTWNKNVEIKPSEFELSTPVRSKQ